MGLSTSAIVARASLVASGDSAIAGYTAIGSDRMRAVYRTTANRGSTWSSQALGPVADR